MALLSVCATRQASALSGARASPRRARGLAQAPGLPGSPSARRQGLLRARQAARRGLTESAK
eukprot:993834-Prymnesium_polylepis.1